jgi:hypothetical protein
MTFKNSQLNSEAIQILNSLIEMDIKATSAFKLMRIIKDISSLVEDKMKAEKKILNKWVEKDANGDVMPILDNNNEIIKGAVKITNMAQFEMDMKELLDMEINIQHDKINFNDLGIVDTLKIKDLLKIDFIFE